MNSKKEKRNSFIIEFCKSYNASKKQQTRDEFVVMTRKIIKNKMNVSNMFFAYKERFLYIMT
jgi:hypothetical protein